MKEELLAMVDELISAIDAQSNLPDEVEVKGALGSKWMHTRKHFISTNGMLLDDIRKCERLGNAEFSLVQMINGMLFYLSFGLNSYPYRLRAMPDQCTVDKAQALVSRWYDVNPQDERRTSKYCFSW